jgi:hypothetical protein
MVASTINFAQVSSAALSVELLSAFGLSEPAKL